MPITYSVILSGAFSRLQNITKIITLETRQKIYLFLSFKAVKCIGLADMSPYILYIYIIMRRTEKY